MKISPKCQTWVNRFFINLCLEGNTERSESNPGRSLGIYKNRA